MSEHLTPAERAAFEARLAQIGPDPAALPEQSAHAGASPSGPTDPALPGDGLLQVGSIAELKRLGGVPDGGGDATISYPEPLPMRPPTMPVE